MMKFSLRKNINEFTFGDLTKFSFDNKVIDIHNLFKVLSIYDNDSSLHIKLESNEYFKSLYQISKEKNRTLDLVFKEYSIDNSFDTKFRVELYNNISSMSFSQANELLEEYLSIDLLFDNNDFFKITCKDCYFELKPSCYR
ncbi:hypothetical protein Q4Q34_07770 [Flavivirga abyssicola]|uniref:hypothetical protein n=1 Tax=Flavivirga abyssicola TaxID=3063533 RepID=UPI0026E02635|nr:hypothetical protein [Flavivirga sp. MEBiC07777]WVK14923.1 hypothetical protein Q4Q34_07770 [Flavivirga sp. MEBiC07777]